jgi:hypothetical protein
MSNIIQHSPEWLEAKKSKIGGSEIFTLVHYYCQEELKSLDVDLDKEMGFKTALELFIKLKFGVEDNNISEVNSVFGNEMEEYINARLNQELPSTATARTRDFIINEELHKLSACSPDGYVELSSNPCQLPDFDKTCLIDSDWEQGILEFKTTPFGFNFQITEGCKWAYIFQLTYNIMVCGARWGILAAITPKDKDFDTDFYKGQVIGKLKAKGVNAETMEELAGVYNFNYYVYKRIPALEGLILKALNCFQNDLDNNVYPEKSGHPAKLARERKVIGLAFPDHYGEWQADEEVANMIEQRMIAKTEATKADSEAKDLEIEIIKKVNPYSKIIGLCHKLVWDKRNGLRFYKI